MIVTYSALAVEHGGLYFEPCASRPLSGKPRPRHRISHGPIPRRSSMNATWGSAVAGHRLPNLWRRIYTILVRASSRTATLFAAFLSASFARALPVLRSVPSLTRAEREPHAADRPYESHRDRNRRYNRSLPLFESCCWYRVT